MSTAPTPSGLTPRQQREREFYDQFARHDACDRRVILDPVTSPDGRPWNPYWHLFRLVKDRFRPGMRLLDFGCGWGSNTILFATVGYQVDGFDISEGNLAVGRDLARQHGVEDRITFGIQAAEALSYPDASFDVIAGIDILHHVDLEPALRECRRVLKPGGVAYFREPVESPLFDPLRNTWLVRRLVPNAASLDRHITEDEKKLTARDLRTVRRVFPDAEVGGFRMFARLTALLPRWETRLEQLDLRVRRLPGVGLLCGAVVLTLPKCTRRA